MKPLRILLSSALLALGMSAYSQEINPAPFGVDVPFDFTMRNTNLPAGQYRVIQSGRVVILQSKAGKCTNMLVIPSYKPRTATRSSLIFEHVGSNYTLSQINNQGSDLSLTAVKSTKHAPRRLEASNGSQATEATVLGSR